LGFAGSTGVSVAFASAFGASDGTATGVKVCSVLPAGGTSGRSSGWPWRTRRRRARQPWRRTPAMPFAPASAAGAACISTGVRAGGQ
jgi:hypothetical protein